jgi:hypothetical protein
MNKELYKLNSNNEILLRDLRNLTKYKKTFTYDTELPAEKIIFPYGYVINEKETEPVVALGDMGLYGMDTSEIPIQLPIIKLKLSYGLGDKIGNIKVNGILIRHESNGKNIVIYSSSDNITDNLDNISLYDIYQEKIEEINKDI